MLNLLNGCEEITVDLSSWNNLHESDLRFLSFSEVHGIHLPILGVLVEQRAVKELGKPVHRDQAQIVIIRSVNQIPNVHDHV